MTGLATLHLFGVEPVGVPAAVARMALDRRHLARTPGLSFWKSLGTGSGRTFAPRDADPLRWGLLGVWSSAAALAAFERSSPVAAAWRRLAVERWRGDLVPLRSRGSWSGRDPFAGSAPPASSWSGPVAAITRARIRWAQQRAFWGAVPPVALDAGARPGLRFAVGIGEAPVGLQGTFSVWDSAAALSGFAYRGAPHRAAITETARRDWYAEELFARFAVVGSTGTVAGRDPLAPSAPATHT